MAGSTALRVRIPESLQAAALRFEATFGKKRPKIVQQCVAKRGRLRICAHEIRGTEDAFSLRRGVSRGVNAAEFTCQEQD